MLVSVVEIYFYQNIEIQLFMLGTESMSIIVSVSVYS